MRKAERQGRILSIIAQSAVETQEDLAKVLVSQGAKATQSTVSRDIKELKLTKRLSSEGKRVYALPEPTDSLPEAASRAAVFAEGYLRSDFSGNIVVVKTRVGMANACAVAVDGLRLREILGTLAGDDTIMVVTRSEAASVALMRRLDDLARGSIAGKE